jgi:putative hydrolase of the HAD superfamily
MQPTASDRRALLIDAMGTLVRLEPPAPALRRELSRRFGAKVSLAQAERAVAAEIGYYRAHMEDGRDAVSVQALRHRCAEALREALPASARLRRVDSASVTEVLLASLRFSAFDDARGALEAARNRNERVIVVSNWDASLSEVLERMGLAPLLDGVVTSAAAGARKPQPAIFERALELAGVGAERAVHVGDSLEEDVGGARAAGIAAVWLNRAHPPRPPRASGPPEVLTIASLSELSAHRSRS